MKLRNKIALTFTGFVTFILLFSFTLIYYLTFHFIEKDFYDLVMEKANLTAWKYFEKDEMSTTAYAKVMKRYEKSLPNSQEIVLDTKYKKQVRDSLDKILPAELVQNLFDGKAVKFKLQEKQGVGIYYPDNQGNFIVIITAVNRFGLEHLHELMEVLLTIFLGSIVLVFLIGQFYARNVLYPIVNLLKNVKRIRAANLSLRLKETGGSDELAELTHTFNQMLDRLEQSFILQKNFIHNASHELKNPLTAILGETEIALGKKRSAEDYVGVLSKIQTEAKRLDQLTRDLLCLAQTDFELSNPALKDVRMDELIWEVKEHFDKTDYKGRLDIHFPNLPENPGLISINGVPGLLKIALLNTVDNACKFSADQKVDITLTSEGENIRIAVTDKGIGIPEPETENLFQPFFRASNAITFKGSGVGLSIVHKIITMHGGAISVSSVPEKGTTIELYFPAKASQQ